MYTDWPQTVFFRQTIRCNRRSRINFRSWVGLAHAAMFATSTSGFPASMDLSRDLMARMHHDSVVCAGQSSLAVDYSASATPSSTPFYPYHRKSSPVPAATSYSQRWAQLIKANVQSGPQKCATTKLSTRCTKSCLNVLMRLDFIVKFKCRTNTIILLGLYYHFDLNILCVA